MTGLCGGRGWDIHVSLALCTIPFFIFSFVEHIYYFHVYTNYLQLTE